MKLLAASLVLLVVLALCGCPESQCFVCDGTGKQDCALCVNGVADCGLCAGPGQNCTFCNGRGSSVCTFCNGGGWRECTFCNGTGKPK